MKKATTIIAVLSVLCLIFGGIIFAVGMSQLDWDYFALDTTEYTKVEYSLTPSPDDEDALEVIPVKSFKYDCTNWNLEITKGDNFAITYYTTELTESHLVTVDAGDEGAAITFTHKEKNAWQIGMFKGLKRFKYPILLTIPHGVDVSINSTNGDVKASDIEFGKFTIESTNADVRLSNIIAAEMKFDATNLGVEISQGKIEKISFDSTNGSLRLNSCETGSLICEGTNSDLWLTQGSAGSVSFHATNGTAIISKCKIASDMSFHGTNMTVKADMDCPLSDFKSVKVTGTNATLKINGTNYSKSAEYSSPESGYLTLTANGTNISVRLTTDN